MADITRDFLDNELASAKQQMDKTRDQYLRWDGVVATLTQLLARLDAPDESDTADDAAGSEVT